MPKPLIILENHFSVGFSQFIIEHFNALKELGYKKVLFELNKEISPEGFKTQLQNIFLRNPNPLYKKYAQNWLKCISILEKNGFPYEFIDPQSQSEALKLAKAVETSSGNQYLENKKELDRVASERDKIMSKIIIHQAQENDGGIVFLGGYEHTTLSRLLEAHQTNFFRYAIFSNLMEDKELFKNTSESIYNWPKIPDIDFRHKYYGTHVAFLDLNTIKSFNIIEAECHLTDSKSCQMPMTGHYLTKITKQDFDFNIDEDYVVSASTLVKNEEAVEKIKRTIPGIHFFIEKRNNDKFINIPGINLTENGKELKKHYDPFSLV